MRWRLFAVLSVIFACATPSPSEAPVATYRVAAPPPGPPNRKGGPFDFTPPPRDIDGGHGDEMMHAGSVPGVTPAGADFSNH